MAEDRILRLKVGIWLPGNETDTPDRYISVHHDPDHHELDHISHCQENVTIWASQHGYSVDELHWDIMED